MDVEQTNESIRRLNQAKADLRLAVSLLRLYGPDELAGAAEQVVSADSALFQLLNVRDEATHNRAVAPSRVREAGAHLEVTAKEFAQLAHRWTR